MGQNQYGDESGEEEDQNVDENGEPLPSPEEVKMIINSINSFKYQEKKDKCGKTSECDKE